MAKEMQIGEIREYNGKKILCAFNEGCESCSFRYKSSEFCENLIDSLGYCSCDQRSDREDVSFVILAD